MEFRLPAKINRQLSHVEEKIESEIQCEEVNPRSKLKRFRKKGKALTHSKTILLLVVILNCADCILVLSELVLDVYFIGGMIKTADSTMETFNKLMQQKYPEQFGNYAVIDTHNFYNKILQSTLVFGDNVPFSYLPGNSTYKRSVAVIRGEQNIDTMTSDMGNKTFADRDDPAFLDETSDSTEEYISHVFHKLSISILAILLAFTVFKVFCEGVHFLKHKIEVFDALVVIASFTLDLCYIRGLTNYRAESFVLILVVMIPWRIIRVLNSLVIAVKDKFHFMLKLMYQKNKVNCAKIEQLEQQRAVNQTCISTLVQICRSRGVDITEINAVLDHEGKDNAGDNGSATKFGVKTLGACFGLSRQESTDTGAFHRSTEMVPLNDHTKQ